MNAYLKCLYERMIGDGFPSSCEDFQEYRCFLEKRNDAYQKIEATLTPEQLDLLDDYLSARNALSEMESGFLFEEAVALGKWMAR